MNLFNQIQALIYSRRNAILYIHKFCNNISQSAQEWKNNENFWFAFACRYVSQQNLLIFSFTAPFLVRMSMVILRFFQFGGGHPLSFSHIVKQVRIFKICIPNMKDHRRNYLYTYLKEATYKHFQSEVLTSWKLLV